VDTLAPDVVAAVSKPTRKKRTVEEGLLNDQWIRDIQGSLSAHALAKYVSLWSRLQGFQLHQEITDKFIWKWSSDHQYSASSAYRAFFHGQCALPGAKELGKMVTQLNANSLFGWLSWIVVGLPIGGNVITRTPAISVPFVIKQMRRFLTYLCHVLTANRYGSGCSGGRVFTTSCQERSRRSQTGGKSPVNRFISPCTKVSTPCLF
jgi:hypothetical protein